MSVASLFFFFFVSAALATGKCRFCAFFGKEVKMTLVFTVSGGIPFVQRNRRRNESGSSTYSK